MHCQRRNSKTFLRRNNILLRRDGKTTPPECGKSNLGRPQST